jgi:hypothetical protein
MKYSGSSFIARERIPQRHGVRRPEALRAAQGVLRDVGSLSRARVVAVGNRRTTGANPYSKVTSAAVPTALREGPYRVYFYSHEPGEPVHMHVDRDELSAKFWLRPVALAENFGFSEHELRRIERMLRVQESRLVKAWNDHFST